MSNQNLTRITDEKQKKQLLQNLESMKECFQGEPFSGEGLAQIMRKMKNDDHSEKNEDFKKKLAEYQPLLYELLSGNTLQGWGTVDAMISGRKEPSQRFVKDLALFCTKAFVYDESVTSEDLLQRDMAPFPPLRQVRERWSRYAGIYRCFYPYHGDRGLELRAALLQMKEKAGELHCCFITGIRRDRRFPEVLKLFEEDLQKNFVAELEKYNKSLPSSEARLACYQGKMDPSISDYFQLRLQRMEEGNNNVAVIFLRRWDKSAQPLYSGGIATVTLCRKDDILTYPMTVTRQEMSLKNEKELLLRHLTHSINGEAGLQMSTEMDKSWNKSVMDWCFWKDEETEENGSL